MEAKVSCNFHVWKKIGHHGPYLFSVKGTIDAMLTEGSATGEAYAIRNAAGIVNVV